MAGKVKKPLKEQLALALADYDNLVKRLEREKEEIVGRATKNLIEDLLPAIDNLERANNHLKDSGLGMAVDQLKTTLIRYGVEEISTEQGDKFDSGVHEAVEIVEGSEMQSGTIAEVLSRGWKWQDGMVIRPVKVKVYGEKQEERK